MIYASIKHAKWDAQQKHHIWKSFNLDKAPQLFVSTNCALETSHDKASKKRKVWGSKLTLTEDYNIRPVKRSMSKVSVFKKKSNYKEDMPSVQ